MYCLNVVGLCLGEIYSFVAIDIELAYVMCLALHLILIILLESTVRRFVMKKDGSSTEYIE